MTPRLPRIFSDLSYLWPLLSPSDDYLPEARSIHRILSNHLARSSEEIGDRPRLLEMGAGGGHTIFHLKESYDIVALDLSEGMLANCRHLNPEVKTRLGDMRTVRLGEKFDAVVIHDAIDYLLDAEEVRQTLETAAIHLPIGGAVLVAPTYVTETFVEHDVEHDHHGDGSTELTYFSYVHRLERAAERVEAILVYLIRKDGRVEVVEDRHEGGLFSTAQWSAMLASAGFDVKLDFLIEPDEEGDPGVPMFVGIKK